jgi:1-hydroxycarotenoid 3,4-desaturase
MPAHRIVVVGAGIGGLAAAVDLASQGAAVTVVERAERAGGKMREVVAGGATIDAGPTVLTMRWVFDELLQAAGTSLDEHVALRPLDVLARHAWNAGATLDLYADTTRSAEAIGDFAGLAAARGFLDFTARARDVYATLESTYLRAPKAGPLSLARRCGVHGLPALWRTAPFASLWSALGTHFLDPRMRQLFGRYATYCGSSPYLSPATLMLVAHVEQQGVWTVDGGMYRIADALVRIAKARGVVLRTGTDVAEVLTTNSHVSGVRLRSGERVDADAVVVNADAAAVAQGLLGAGIADAVPRAPVASRSLSALTWAISARASGFALARHNVFFSADYAAEFAAIFRRGELPGAPTVYVCAQDRDGADAGDRLARERMLCIVNAPANGDTRRFTPSEIEQCEERTFSLLDRCGLVLEHNRQNTMVTTPAEFAAMFPATGGALYGRASHGWRASFQRPGARTRIPGLYLAGGSTHPGPGVPMAALSGRMAAASVLSDLASMRRSSRVAMPGGTSMRFPGTDSTG